jgi:hypothetical protein
MLNKGGMCLGSVVTYIMYVPKVYFLENPTSIVAPPRGET